MVQRSDRGEGAQKDLRDGTPVEKKTRNRARGGRPKAFKVVPKPAEGAHKDLRHGTLG